MFPEAAAPPDIVLRDIAHVWQRDGKAATVLDGINLQIPGGSFHAFIGPSGCGKSTLLRIIAAIIQPSRGEVRIGGRSARDVRLARGMGFVFQHPALLSWRSVLQNVALPREIAGDGMPCEDPLALIELVGLSGYERAYPRELSGGMRQRVGIARALMLRPRILLLDEPFGALDEITRQRLNLELLRIWQQRGMTVILVTHTLSEAVFLADRVHVLGTQPARIVETIDIGLDRPRHVGQLSTLAFTQAESRVRTALFGTEMLA